MSTQEPARYTPQNQIRIVTAASLFDGHDATINVMRRVIQGTGAEVIHLGHDRSVQEVVDTAIEEDAQGIAITSYQGGHLEYFKYMYDLLQERGAGHVQLFGGGGGTILPHEAEELENYGINKIFSPDDGRKMGLQGMINHLMQQCDFQTICNLDHVNFQEIPDNNPQAIAQAISYVENHPQHEVDAFHEKLKQELAIKDTPVLGITGTGGAGKSSLTDELIRRFLNEYPDKRIAVISVDPSKRKTGGALLGDRIRMNAIHGKRAYMRSLATRQPNISVSPYIEDAVNICKRAQYDLIVLESSGIGQADSSIVDYCDVAMYIMTPEFGAATQLEKIDMLDYADIVGINKFDKRGALDAIWDVQKQYKRNHGLFEAENDSLPIYGTIASQFNDPGMNNLFKAAMETLTERTDRDYPTSYDYVDVLSEKIYIIPPERVRYLSEIADNNRRYDNFVEEQAQIASKLYKLSGTLELLQEQEAPKEQLQPLRDQQQELEQSLQPETKKALEQWPDKKANYQSDTFTYKVRDKEFEVKTHRETISGTKIPKVALPEYRDWGDQLQWLMTENVPGEFPYTAGVFPFKREGEDPTRMFAGEGTPERTNKRFHYLSKGTGVARLSTAFDSVTLYGEDPATRPDIYGKVGNSGVSIATLDDAKKLYSGFDLADPTTSVSMTINGPAPMILAYYMNTAVDQQCEKYIREQGMTEQVEQQIADLYEQNGWTRPGYQGQLPGGNDGLGLMMLGVTGDQVLPAETYEKIKEDTLRQVRGTVQADILKEDQAQNTCIFSTEFALKMMGDVQEYFIDHKMRNFYSVSISGYHIGEAGANPITQLALTLSNAFTYVEYYRYRGMDIDEFGPNLSFFFSNGIDAEYAVVGRVARRIWSKSIRYLYGGGSKAQKLKYHIQTSGRSLHAQEISFNDIRTTLQALYAIYDNCNSLHTNASDEAITTPTEDSVRQAMAIQLIINKELGLAQNENPNQGAFIIDKLTDLVEEAVYAEFDRLTERGGVLGAMENMYQRNKIQEESLYYEGLKHSGELPIIGVNTFLSEDGSPAKVPDEVIRSDDEEKHNQINMVEAFKERNHEHADQAIKRLQEVAGQNGNIYEELMETTKVASLGQITHALYDVGGRYRRSM
jgi:methylmalonyl-CoA mutase